MKRGLQLQILWIPIVLLTLAIAGVSFFFVSGLRAHLLEETQADLFVRAAVLVDAAAREPAHDVAAWDAFADREGRLLGVRVTLVREDGKLFGDSELDLAGLGRAADHATRPEVASAFRSGSGVSVRASATVGRPLLYVAAVGSFEGRRGCVRLAKSLSEIEDSEARFRTRVLLVAGIVLVVTALVLARIARRITGDVSKLTETAHEMTEGNLDVRTRFKGYDELGQLGRALDQLSNSLSSSLAQLTREHGRLDRILHGMQEGVVLLDEHGKIVLVNAALRSMLLAASDAVGKPLDEVFKDEQLRDLLRQGLSQRGNHSLEVELTGLTPKRLLVQLVALEPERELLAVFVDVTELRRLEKIRKDFVANVSHELRTPVSAVRSATETLQAGALADPVASKRFLDIALRNTLRLENLIEDLLELSRVESRQFQPRLEEIDLAYTLGQVVTLYRERAEKKKLRIVLEVPPDLVVTADPRAIEQIVGNLVDNAVKYGERGVITVLARAQEGEFVCEVSDQGPGIDEKHLSRLFERFYRIDKGRSREIGGTGLGLSIVKHLVEVLGGDIRVASKVGAGTTFTVTLPKDGKQSIRSLKT